MTERAEIGEVALEASCPKCGQAELFVPVWEDNLKSPLFRKRPSVDEGTPKASARQAKCHNCGSKIGLADLGTVVRLAEEVRDRRRRLEVMIGHDSKEIVFSLLPRIIARFEKEENLEMLEGLRDVIAKMEKDVEPETSIVDD